ncbi:hypothetical protein NDU88_008504 [Pleurodeles waltl]|uniref:Uncharacterized protein n=1 Tax=Pleurodeles waltl TaxID=8319 RepID=A0AAV7QRY2_PLEWA|nr:hypothetical protein NDU88_008504 [Pleurodeles waltl]
MIYTRTDKELFFVPFQLGDTEFVYPCMITCWTSALDCRSVCNGPLLTATDPPDSTELHNSATPNQEGQCERSNPLLLLGAEGQSQRLYVIGLLKPESEEDREEETDGRCERSSSTEESHDGSRGDVTDDGESEAQLRDPESSGAGGAQCIFQPRLGKSVAPPGGWKT